MVKAVRIGCGAGFWGDSAEGPKQLVESGEIDYLILDYLAEITMSLLARARGKDPSLGYATDFPALIARLASRIKADGVKVVTNAGGVNPAACREALQKLLAEQGIELSVGVVNGDDLMPQIDDLRQQGVREMFSGAEFPANPWSANAYLGAFPIAEALGANADIVITGRCVDSALALGPLIHEFGWKADDYDHLAAGSLAGHVIECGTQATGGIVTDWEGVADDWDNMGFPIAVCRADGGFDVTKPAGTGGRVTPESVAEQIVYEIGDPAAYWLPDVCCDFRDIELSQRGPDCVSVSGVRGLPPSASYKASVTYQDGFRSTGTMMIGGREAKRRAEAVAAAILKRTRRLFADRGMDDYARTDVEVLGAEANWGANARHGKTREVILKLSVQHADKSALALFSREFIPAATSMAQSITGFAGGRPAVTPLVRLFSCLAPKASMNITVDVDGRAIPHSQPQTVAPTPVTGEASHPEATVAGQSAGQAIGATRVVPLIALAYGRSGDKGNSANIGVLARRAEFLPVLRAQMTAQAVKQYLQHFVEGEVHRYEWPGLNGFNFLLEDALGGGGIASLRYDPQGKMLAQILMDLPIQAPETWFEQGLLPAQMVGAA